MTNLSVNFHVYNWGVFMGIKDFMKIQRRKFSETNDFTKNYTAELNVLKDSHRYNAQNVFNPTVLSWIFVAVTFFLQIISLATTYSGSKVYFGGIKLPLGLSAPFLFALSVQLIVFFLSNSLKRNLKAGTVMILLTAAMCSTYFSYIGIYNHINSPIIYLEERYNQIYGSMTDKYRTVVDNSKNKLKESIFDIIGKLQQENTKLVKEIDSYNKLAEQVSKVSINTNVVTANTAGVSKPNINNYANNLDKYYEDMAKYSSAIGNIVGQAASQNSSIQASLYENKVKTILGGKTLAEFNKELADMTSKKQLMDNIVETMYNSISAGNTVEFDKRTNEIQQYCVNYINSKTGDREKFNTILTNMFTLYSDITSTDTPKGFNDVLNLFYTTTEVSENFMKALKDIENNVYMEDYGKAPQGDISLNLSDSMLLFSKLQSEIKNGAYLLNSFTDKGNAIDLNSEEFALENMYVLPLKNLLSKNDSLGIAWFSFAFAALIDGLTLLFALISKSSRHLLSAKKNSQIAGNSEELMEELLLSSLILHRAENKDKENIQNILEHLANFLTLFKITPFGMEEGFSLYCPLDKLSEYQIFLSVICQFNLAKIISHEDFELLRTVPSMEEFETLIEEQSSLADSLDEVAAMKLGNNNPAYVLLKTKFIVWVNKKLSAASSDKKLSIILTDILKNIEYSNETY